MAERLVQFKLPRKLLGRDLRAAQALGYGNGQGKMSGADFTREPTAFGTLVDSTLEFGGFKDLRKEANSQSLRSSKSKQASQLAGYTVVAESFA